MAYNFPEGARFLYSPLSGFATAKNISRLQTAGFDFEAAYRMPLSNLISNASGTLAFRALATR